MTLQYLLKSVKCTNAWNHPCEKYVYQSPLSTCLKIFLSVTSLYFLKVSLFGKSESF